MTLGSSEPIYSIASISAASACPVEPDADPRLLASCAVGKHRERYCDVAARKLMVLNSQSPEIGYATLDATSYGPMAGSCNGSCVLRAGSDKLNAMLCFSHKNLQRIYRDLLLLVLCGEVDRWIGSGIRIPKVNQDARRFPFRAALELALGSFACPSRDVVDMVDISGLHTRSLSSSST